MNTSTFEIITLAERDTSNLIHKYVLFDQPFIDILVEQEQGENYGVSDFFYGDEFVFDMFHERKATHIITKEVMGDCDVVEHKYRIHLDKEFVTTVDHIHGLQYDNRGEALVLVHTHCPEVWFYADEFIQECVNTGVDEIEVVISEGEK